MQTKNEVHQSSILGWRIATCRRDCPGRFYIPQKFLVCKGDIQSKRAICDMWEGVAVMEEEIIVSDIEFEGDIVEPDNEPPQKKGDASVEVTDDSGKACSLLQ